uniref:Uncharacterized protein n=1 Tax=Arundo donax TaxID=35708 RepID=A0A0A9AA76_ARUDO
MMRDGTESVDDSSTEDGIVHIRDIHHVEENVFGLAYCTLFERYL